MLVCRPFSCILGVHNAGNKRTKRCCKRTFYNISEHTKTYVISVRIAVDKRVGMLSHEDSWGNLAYCFLPSYLSAVPFWGIAGGI